MKSVGLFRVSTETQANEGASLDAQQRRYREWCSQNGAESLGEFRGQESAAKAAAEREVLQRVLRCIRDEAPDVLWIFEQSRLTRGDELEVALLVRELRERAVKVAVGGAIRDLASIDDTLMFGVQSLMDRAEHARFRERTARGRREKALQGKRTGKAPFGYRNPPKGDPRRGTLQIEEAEAAIVRQIFEQVAAGDSARTIVARLNALGVPAPKGGRWGKTTIRSVIRNRTYIGVNITSAWKVKDGVLRFDASHPSVVIVPDTHEPLVTPALFEQARAASRGHSTGLPCLLTGLLFVNGRRANVDKSSGHSYYVPADHQPGPWVQAETVNAAAWESFGSLFCEPDALLALLRGIGEAAAPEAPEHELEALARQEARLRARLDRLVQMRADGEIERAEFNDSSASTRAALQEAQRAAQAIKRRAAVATDGDLERAVLATRALLGEHALGMAQKRRLLKAMVHSVFVEVKPRKQARKRRGGGFASSQRWRVSDLWFRLFCSTGPDRSITGSDRGEVAVVAIRPRPGRAPELVEQQAVAG